MPTHQGTTQTDILVGGGGDSAQVHTEFEFFATYASTASLEYADLAPGTDRQYSGYELIVRDPMGAPLAAFAARYKSWIDRGSATGSKTIDIQNSFNPAPSGSTPSWPLSAATTADREWSVDTFDTKGDLYAKLYGTWQVRSTVASKTATVVQTVTDQTDALLRVHLVYMDGATVLLDVVATMPAGAMVSGGVTADPPDVIDRFTP